MKEDISKLANYVEFYNQIVWDVVNMASKLGYENILLEIKFNVLKLKNVYSALKYNH